MATSVPRFAAFRGGLPDDFRNLPSVLVYLVGFTYSITLGMAFVLVPLYVLDLGYDVAAVGLVVSAQGIASALLRLPAGAISDRFGERQVLLATFATMVLGAGGIVFISTLWPLFAFQMVIGISGAIYWTPSQSYASRSVEGKTGTVLGEAGGVRFGRPADPLRASAGRGSARR